MGYVKNFQRHLDAAKRTGIIQLSESGIRELPRHLLEYTQLLKSMDLNTNKFTQLDDELTAFTNLKTLILSHNKVTCISSSIRQLTKLETLQLDDNLIECLPSEFELLVSLKSLNLSSNKLKEAPREICSLKNLVTCDLSRNEIESIPDEICQTNANEINLNHNKLQSLNDSLARCAKLKVLRVDNNLLTAEAITKPILADSKICLLSLENNQFTLKQLQERDGYNAYSDRFVSTRRKMA